MSKKKPAEIPFEFVAIPRALLKNAVDLGIGPQELQFLCILFQAMYWKEFQWPYLGIGKTIAAQMGISARKAKKWAARLEEKGLLIKRYGYHKSITWDLSPLFEKLGIEVPYTTEGSRKGDSQKGPIGHPIRDLSGQSKRDLSVTRIRGTPELRVLTQRTPKSGSRTTAHKSPNNSSTTTRGRSAVDLSVELEKRGVFQKMIQKCINERPLNRCWRHLEEVDLMDAEGTVKKNWPSTYIDTLFGGDDGKGWIFPDPIDDDEDEVWGPPDLKQQAPF